MADRFFRDLEQPKYPHLVRPGGGLSGEMYDLREDISRGFGRVDLGTTSATEAEMQVWVHAQDGDDDNDGLTLATAKQTLAAGFDVIPHDVLHNVALNLRGTFDDFGYWFFDKYVAQGILFIIDGGDEYDTLAGPWTADVFDTTQIGDTGLGLTVDQYAGKYILIDDGPMAGAVTLIQSHDATTFVPCQHFDLNPGAASFRIIEPKTVLKGTSILSYLLPRFIGDGAMLIQRLRFEDRIRIYPRNAVTFNGVVVKNPHSTARFEFSGSVAGILGTGYTDPVTFAYGYGQWNGLSSERLVQINGGEYFGLFSCFLSAPAKFYHLQRFQMNFGARVKDYVQFTNCHPGDSFGIKNSSGHAPTKIDNATGSGLRLIKSTMQINADVVIENHSTHGIEVDDSWVKLNGEVKGTGNGGAGVYAHLGAKVITKSGDQPTITGTAGDCSLDGSTGIDLGSGVSDFWTDIESGSVVDKDLAADKEFCVVKKV